MKKTIWLLLIFSLICAFSFSSCENEKRKIEIYRSSCTFIVKKSGIYDTVFNSNELVAIHSLIEMSNNIIVSSSFCETVINELNIKYDNFKNVKTVDVQKMLSVNIFGDTTVFSIDVSSTDRELSCAISGIVYDIYPEIFSDVFSSYAVKIERVCLYEAFLRN